MPAHLDVTEYDEETLEKIVQSYVQQATTLKWLGFDMISFHFAYRNQLPARFMSPLTNHRTDEYNGSVENRCRYAKRVLHAVREAVGRDMLLEVLVSAEEPEGGYTLDDTVSFLRMVEDDIDIVQLRAPEADPNHPTGFCLEETPLPALRGIRQTQRRQRCGLRRRWIPVHPHLRSGRSGRKAGSGRHGAQLDLQP